MKLGYILRALILYFCLVLGLTPCASSQEENPQLKTLQVHSDSIYRIKFNPTGDAFASASFDNSIQVRSFPDGRLLADFSDHEDHVLDLAFSPQKNELFSVGRDRRLIKWEFQKGIHKTIPTFPKEDLQLVKNNANTWIAGVSKNKKLVFWDLGAKTLNSEHTLKVAPRKGISSFNKNLLVTVMEDNSFHIYNGPKLKSALSPNSNFGDLLLGPEDKWQFLKGTSQPSETWHSEHPADRNSKWEEGLPGFGYSSNESELGTVNTLLGDMRNKYSSLYIKNSFHIPSPEDIQSLTLELTYEDAYILFLNGEEVGRANITSPTPNVFPPFHTKADSTKEPIKVTLNLSSKKHLLKEGENWIALAGYNTSLGSSDFILSPLLYAKTETKRTNKKSEILIHKSEPLSVPIKFISGAQKGFYLALGLEDNQILIYEGKNPALAQTIQWEGGNLTSLLLIDKNNLWAGGDDGTIRKFDPKDGNQVLEFQNHNNAVTSLQVSPWNSATKKVLFASYSDGKVITCGKTGEPINTYEYSNPVPMSVDLSLDGSKIASSYADGRILIRDLSSGNLLDEYKLKNPVSKVIVIQGEYYGLSENSEVTLLKPSIARQVIQKQDHSEPIYAVAVSPDGSQVITAGADKQIRSYTTQNLQYRRNFHGHKSSIYCLAFSPDGNILASADYDGVIKLWKAKQGAEISTIEGHRDGIFDLCFSRSGETLFSASSDHSVFSWNVATYKKAQSFVGHSNWTFDLANSKTGEPALFSSDYQGKVIRWNPANGEKVAETSLKSIVFGMDVSPDGQWLITGNADGSINILPSPKE